MASLGATRPAALRLDGYGVSLGSKVVLAGVDMELPPDGLDVLMGPVSAGKSTLLRSLAGLHDGNAQYRTWGSALMGGTPLAAGHRPRLLQQHAAVVNASVRDALVFHVRQTQERSAADWEAAAHQALQRHGLGGLRDALGQPMLDLPVEPQRAIGILSHVLARPTVLMVDEPTYGLQDASALWLIDWLRHLREYVRMLVCLHHQGWARRLADRVTLLGGGRVLASDTVGRFFAHPANAWAEQFVRTGSLSIASADARAEDLTIGNAPPPLPDAAQRAIASVVSHRQPWPPSEPHATRLPRTSVQGVQIAAAVGKAAPVAYRGPVGFHWIVPGKLAGCAYPGSAAPLDYDLQLLTLLGVTYLITLTRSDLDRTALASAGLKNIHLPIYDREAPTVHQAYMLARRIQQLMDQGEVLVVHCRAGVGRTGTVLACWLIREGGLSAASAIARLRAINPAYVQTPLQEQFLSSFEDDMTRRL